MIQTRLDFEFACQLIDDVLFPHHLFWDDFNGAHKACGAMLRDVYAPELAATQLFAQVEVLDF